MSFQVYEKKNNTSELGFSRKQHSGKKISFSKMFFYQNRRLKNPNRLNYISFHKHPFKRALKRSSEKTENYILSLWHISCNLTLQYMIVKQCSIKQTRSVKFQTALTWDVFLSIVTDFLVNRLIFRWKTEIKLINAFYITLQNLVSVQ